LTRKAKMNKEKERKNEKTQIWTRKFLLIANPKKKEGGGNGGGGRKRRKREMKNGRKSYKSFGDSKILTITSARNAHGVLEYSSPKDSLYLTDSL
jgi:hypothetical protein